MLYVTCRCFYLVTTVRLKAIQQARAKTNPRVHPRTSSPTLTSPTAFRAPAPGPSSTTFSRTRSSKAARSPRSSSLALSTAPAFHRVSSRLKATSPCRLQQGRSHIGVSRTRGVSKGSDFHAPSYTVSHTVPVNHVSHHVAQRCIAWFAYQSRA